MIRGRKINLRPITEEDLEELYRIESDISELGDFDAFHIKSKQKYLTHFKETGFWSDDYSKMLLLDKSDVIIGEISCFKGMKYVDGYEIGYKIYRKKDRGNGYMSEALKIFTSYLFSLNPFRRISVNMFSGNIASEKLAQKCGYTYEGLMRKAVFCRGRYYDLKLYSILREECVPFDKILDSL